MAQITTLYEYYKSIGQSLPSWQDRKAVYEKAGLGSADSYTGSGSQNDALLKSLIAGGSTKEEPEANASDTIKKDDIRGDIQRSLEAYKKNPDGFREDFIENLVKNYGEESREFIKDTTYEIMADTGSNDGGGAGDTGNDDEPYVEKEQTRYGYGILGEKFETTSLKADYDKWLGDKSYTKDYEAPTSLDDYYKRMNENVPGSNGKAALYTELGLEGDYYGTAEQDNKILAGLLSKAQSNYTSAGGTGNIAQTEEDKGNKWSKMLTGDTAQIYAQYRKMLEEGSAEEQKAWLEALDSAGEDSDAYFKEQLNIFKDEFKDALGILDTDLEAREDELTKSSQRLKDDLENTESDLSIEQKAELTRRKESYDVSLENTRNTIASRGLSSSSIRNQAEEKLNTTQEDIIESTQRNYDRQLRSARLAESRGLADNATNLEWLQRKAKEAKTAGVKGAEQRFGSKEVNAWSDLGELDFSKYTSGLVSQGTENAEQALDIKSRANVLLTDKFY